MDISIFIDDQFNENEMQEIAGGNSSMSKINNGQGCGCSTEEINNGVGCDCTNSQH